MRSIQPLLVALVGLSLGGSTSWAQELEYNTASRLYHRRAPLSTTRLFPGKAAFFEGVLEQGEDGQLFLVNPVGRQMRRRISEAQQRPLQSIPKEVRRAVLVAPGGPTSKEIESWLGRRVRAELVRDVSGHAFVRTLSKPQ